MFTLKRDRIMSFRLVLKLICLHPIKWVVHPNKGRVDLLLICGCMGILENIAKRKLTPLFNLH